MQRFEAFRCRYLENDVLISIDNELLILLSGDVDIAVYYGEGTYPGLITELLIVNSAAPICSPYLLSEDHPRRTLNDLINLLFCRVMAMTNLAIPHTNEARGSNWPSKGF